MERLADLISKKSKSHGQFTYYLNCIEIAKNNIEHNPDITIETCKSVLEGIFKTILKDIDHQYKKDRVATWKFKPLSQRCIKKLSDYQTGFELEFIDSLLIFFNVLCEIRNKRGDISHGKESPKSVESSSLFADLVFNLLDQIGSYIFQCYLSIDISYKDQILYDDEENEGFNQMLDEQYDLGGISYSEALYYQDYEMYIEMLENYLDSENEEDI